MLAYKVLIGKLGAVDAQAASAIPLRADCDQCLPDCNTSMLLQTCRPDRKRTERKSPPWIMKPLMIL